MVTVHIITVGRASKGWVSDQIEHYRKLLAKYARLEITTVPEEKYTARAEISRLLAREARRIEMRLKGGYLIILDTRGQEFNTTQFARELQRRQNKGVSIFEFVIGGPYGLDKILKDRADLLLSLSPLTMSHQIVRGVLLEQLYRAFNLNAGGNYHK